MLTISSLVPGQVYTNDDIVEAFGCSPQGGMRRSYKTNTLVIFALHHKSLYDDQWQNDILHYTGMGQENDQDINFAQNKTLADSGTNGVTVHLFESYCEKEFIYDGTVKLADKPYYGKELDVNSNLRKVIKFPIKLITGMKAVPTSKMVSSCQKNRAKIINKIPDVKLKEAAKSAGNKKPKQSTNPTTTYDRNELVSENAKRRAKGKCDLCDKNAPFNSKHGPYLECHHVIRLADGGPDTIYNTVALCPNCHRKIHILKNKTDIKKLINKIGEYVEADSDQQVIDDYKKLFKL